MSNIIGDTACPKCQESGRDSTGNHLILFEDGGGYCNRCDYTKPKNGDYYHEKEESLLTFEEIQGLPVKALDARGVNADTAAHYGVRAILSPSDRSDQGYCYPIYHKDKIVAYRVRELPKRFHNVGESLKGVPVQLFGQQTCKGSKKLLIVGGQDDMLASYQMLKSKYPNSYPNVVSVTNGENLKSISDNIDFVNKYEEVILCFDQDDAGYRLTEKAAKLIGPKAKTMKISENDPNKMLDMSKGHEFVSSFFNAAGYVPDGFVTVDDVYEEATSMPEWGDSWPWPSLTKLTYGMRNGEGAYFGAGVKVGKSEAVNEIAHHVTTVLKQKIALFKLEEKPAMTVRKLAGKIMKKPFHKPDGEFTQEELKEGVDKVRNGPVLYDAYGCTEWDRLKVAIRHAVVVEGVTKIIIDPLTRLTAGMPSAEANTELERISDEISTMAKDLGFFYMFFCHLKAPQNGKPHEEGGKVHSNQFTGSRAMMRACYYMIGIERNKDPDLDELERNTSTFVLLEDRAFGNAGRFRVFFNKETGDYLEPYTPEGIGFN